MSERKEFRMTQAELAALMESSKPVPYLLGSGGMAPSSPQERANQFWETLSAKHGFKFMSARPVKGKGPEFFEAEVVS